MDIHPGSVLWEAGQEIELGKQMIIIGEENLVKKDSKTQD